ncbi:multifunctional 2',3'-cyclic-nucleotide 2'-phosphodiesterase/5'-nucleotidase/3'-nucleotidase [Sporosarcina sp. PTS2304]|uniref:5'-nucleotidase C-terminal domain-containing protein n=1 Tax=Sporosarcina sp. PTS2304 TaxID=2283194 RepID=UPI000E0CD05C|nr:5'-nucleotidase C-terminal domain-containing protein [Sporosarcina sp. PTS2304]AXH98364.1 multifunctional 2',3'-cyclic-nucleotide 2'-phosphodiesterase/5'-nucleotidase/3'-nucleotidase [Sporosarcina sp. PTS2304]
MTKKIIKWSTASALLLSAASITPTIASAEQTPKENFSLTVLHSNDTHAHVENAPEKAALVKQLKKDNPTNLLLDAGDVFSGTLYFNEFEGEIDMKLMNYYGYDAMTLGNHEFDLGRSENGHSSLLKMIKAAEFPVVSANVDFSKDSLFDGTQTKTITDAPENGHIYNGIIKEVNGEKIGILGLTTEETVYISSPEKVTFTNYIAEAKAAVSAFEKAGVNKIIAVTHIGFDDNKAIDNDQELAKAVPEIDIIVGGHTHSKLPSPHVINEDTNPVVIVQANEYNKFLGQLDVEFDANGVITKYDGKLHQIGGEGAPRDEGAAEILAPYKKQVETRMESPVGATSKVFLNGLRNLGGVRAGETNLGNLITDGMLEKAKEIDPAVKIAFQNGGGIRSSINKGEVTYGEVLTVLPFGNPLAIVELSGAELKSTFEHSVKEYPKESGGFLHVAGMKFLFDPSKPVGSRVVSLEVDGKEVVDSQMYKAATNVFTARGGDGFEALGKAYEAGRVSEPGFSDWENFAEHLKSLKTIDKGIEGRIMAKVPFTDVKENSWAYPYISDLYYRDLLSTATATFKPGDQLTRAQATSFIVRALELPVDSSATMPFKDLNEYAVDTQHEIAAAYTHEIIKGYGDQFKPNAPVTRAQFAQMIKRAYENYTGTPYVPTASNPFNDLGDYGKEAKDAIAMMAELDIADGDKGHYMPTASTTRQQTAKLISNFIYNTKQVKKAE